MTKVSVRVACLEFFVKNVQTHKSSAQSLHVLKLGVIPSLVKDKQMDKVSLKKKRKKEKKN
jgi:hypothetical protein